MNTDGKLAYRLPVVVNSQETALAPFHPMPSSRQACFFAVSFYGTDSFPIFLYMEGTVL